MEATTDTPVILVNGARQSGKSTLVKDLATADYPATYMTMDDMAVYTAASHDPDGFIKNLDGPTILDEIQRVPELFLPIKAAVDRNREPGRFILTGSANVMLLPRISDSLAGRIEIHTLWPLAEAEIEGMHRSIVDTLLTDKFALKGSWPDDDDVAARMTRGGFPEVLNRKGSRLATWFDAYVQTILMRDILDLAQIADREVVPRLLNLLAAQATGLINYTSLARDARLSLSTLKRYIALLEMTYLINFLPSWSTNLSQRAIKTRKVLLTDTGLMMNLIGVGKKQIEKDHTLFGKLFENFVITEISKHLTWSDQPARLYYLRTASGREIDMILESRDGRVVAIEVKARRTLKPGDFRHIEYLRDEIGPRFHGGIVIYTGDKTIPFGDNLYALPVSALWKGW